LLNKLYMTQHVRKDMEEKEADMCTLREFLSHDRDEHINQLLAAKLPVLDEALARFRGKGLDKHGDPREQQRLVARLVRAVKRIDERKQQPNEEICE